MSSAKIIKDRNEENNSKFTTRIIDIFVIAILCIFPLAVTDKYYNILQTKYYFYIGSVCLVSLVILMSAFVEHKKIKRFIIDFQWKAFVKRFTITDITLLIFLLTAIISTICSDYVYESFWGNEGRFSGLFLLGLYGIAYFLVTRLGKFRDWYLDVFLGANMIVCLFGITDYFKMDILHFKADMIESQKFIFTSTIGNINTYTALVGMVVAVAAVLFSIEKVWKRKLYYYICMVIGFFALIMGISDNAYLSLAALFGLLPLFLFKNKKGIKNYMIIIATFFSVIQFIDWINDVMGEKVYGIDSAFSIIVNYKGLIWIVIGLWLIISIWYVAEYRRKEHHDLKNNFMCYAWFGFIIIAIIVFIYVLYDVNVNGNVDRYGALKGYLLFDDDWGTHRGYIWRNAMECFSDFSPIKKLIGFGPDTFGIILLDKTQNNIYGEIYDTAHNEYIHYLLTVGIVGVTSYIIYLCSFIVNGVRICKKNPIVIAIVMAVICYSVQAFVNLNLPIATPIMWMLLMLGELKCREVKLKEE